MKLQDIIDNKIAVWCETHSSAKKVNAIISKHLRMKFGDFEYHLTNTPYGQLCYSNEGDKHAFGWGSKKWYEEHEYTIIPASEFIAVNSEPVQTEQAPAEVSALIDAAMLKNSAPTKSRNIDQPVRKFKVGDKVVPVDKTVWGDLSQSGSWKKAQAKNQPFLFVNVVGYVRQGGEIVPYLCSDIIKQSGDYFNESDLIPYVEPAETPHTIIAHYEQIGDSDVAIVQGEPTLNDMRRVIASYDGYITNYVELMPYYEGVSHLISVAHRVRNELKTIMNELVGESPTIENQAYMSKLEHARYEQERAAVTFQSIPIFNATYKAILAINEYKAYKNERI